MWSDEVCSPDEQIFPCVEWVAFKYIEKSLGIVCCVLELINKSSVGEVLSNTKKEEPWSALWLHDAAPTYASSIPNPLGTFWRF